MRLLFTVFLTMLLSCLLPAQKTFIDWEHIDKVNAKNLDDILTDIMFDEKFQPQQHKGCFRSWKSGSSGFNCTNYGAFMWIIDQTIRTNSTLGYQFIREHIVHMTEYGYDWGNGPDPHFHHHPGGEGVGDHPVWGNDPKRPGKSNNWDSDILRHVHLEPYAYVLRLLFNDPSFLQKTGLTQQEISRLYAMVIDWANNWYLKVDWMDLREGGDLFQYGRGMVPARGLMEVYYLTKEWKYFAAAEYIFACTFYNLHRYVEGRNASRFFAYDTGYEDEKRVRTLRYFSAHFNMEPWQAGFIGDTAVRIYAAAYSPVTRLLCAEVIIDISDWVVRQSEIPLGDLTSKGSKDFILSFFQGGNLGFLWNTPQTPMMDPLTALTLDPNTQFIPLVLLRAHYWDGGYWTELLPNSLPRAHYPKELGVQTSVPNFYNWADIMIARYLLTGEKSDLYWALWVYRDSKCFPNRSSSSLFRQLSKPDWIVYGAGNVGKTRGFAEWARGSMLAMPILRHFDYMFSK